jgi:tetratricopeptide (TPR) repeat protein
LGLLGFAFLILIAIIFLRNVFFNFKREDDPAKIGIIAGGIASIFALLFCALTDFSFHIPSITFIFIVVCFIVWPEEKARRVVKFGQPNYQKKKFMAIVLFLSLVYLSMFLLSIKLFAADIFFYKFSYSQGNFNSRINYLEKAVFFNSNNAEYRYALGKTYFDEATTLRDKYQAQSIKFLEQAKINFERAIISQPTNWKYHFFNGSAELTLLYLKVKGYSLEEAQKSFDRAIELNPNEYEMYSYLGNYYLAFEPDKAFRYYRKLIMLKPRYLNDVLNTIWKINNNPDFIREAIPDDSFLIVKYADFLKIKGMEAEKFYKEAADLSVK